MATDVGFGVSWDEQTKSHFNRSPTYNYIFDYRGRNSDSNHPEWMGKFTKINTIHNDCIYPVARDPINVHTGS